MTDKHIWKNGETITADLLNGMSDYADEKVDAIPKIDPDTLVKTTALASDVNLLTGTSAQWQTKKFSSSEANSVWFNIPTASNGNFAISLDAGTTVTYSVMLKPPVDAYAEIMFTSPDETDRQEFRGNIIKAGETGISTVTAVVPDGYMKIKFVSIRVLQQVTDVNARTAMEWSWKCEKANVGPYATPYNKKFVTSVGGQDADSTGNINMDAYALKDGTSPLTVNGKPVVVQSDIDTLNNKISALQAQISGGGGVNLIDRTGEISNAILLVSGEQGSDPYGAIMAGKVAVAPGEVLHFSSDYEITGSVGFRWNWYNDAGIYMARQSNMDKNEFDWTVPEGAYYIRVSYPMAATVVSLTVVNPIAARLAAIEAQIN